MNPHWGWHLRTKLLTQGETCCLHLLLYQGFGHFEWHCQVCSTHFVQLSVSLRRAASATTTLTLVGPLRKGCLASTSCMSDQAYICAFMCGCRSLYHVGIRPFALVLITLCCLHRPHNLPPPKCGFKKKRINPFALVVYVLSLPVSQFPKFLSL